MPKVNTRTKKRTRPIAEVDPKYAVLAKLGKQDFWYFCTQILDMDILEPMPHQMMCREAELLGTDTLKGQHRFMLQMWPREFLKSAIFTQAYVVWRLINNPKERILITNAKLDNAKQFLNWIKKQFEFNDKIKALYGDFTTKEWYTESIRVRGSDYGAKEMSVTIASIDASVVSRHFSLIIADDLVSREQVGTEHQVATTITYFRDIFDLLDKKTGQFLVIGTRWAHHDLYGWMMEEFHDDPKWRFVVKSAYEEDEETGERTLLYPSKYSWEELDDLLRYKGPEEFWNQIMNKPMVRDDEKLSRPRLIDMDDVPKHELDFYLLVDPGASTKAGADPSASLVIGQGPNDKLYLVDVFQGRVDIYTLINAMFEQENTWHVRKGGVETVALGKFFWPVLNSEMKRRRRQFPVIELKAKANKADRIRALEPYLRRGDFYIVQDQPWSEATLRQFENWPNTHHDDVIDAAAYILQIKRPYLWDRLKEGLQRMTSAGHSKSGL